MAAFITFELQEGFERACEVKGYINWRYQTIANKELLNAPLYFTEAPEPTNIIWEHRDKTPKEQLKRKIIAFIAIILVLIVAFIIFYVLKRTTIKNSIRYPSSTNCDAIYSLFESKPE